MFTNARSNCLNGKLRIFTLETIIFPEHRRIEYFNCTADNGASQLLVIRSSEIPVHYFPRTRSHEPARRRLHQRPATSEPHPSENSRNGWGGCPPLHYITAAPRVPWMRLENPESLPGNRLDQTRRDRRQ